MKEGKVVVISNELERCIENYFNVYCDQVDSYEIKSSCTFIVKLLLMFLLQSMVIEMSWHSYVE